MIDLVDNPFVELAPGIERDFLEFHRANPQVYRRLVEMTRALVARGHTRVGMKMLFEVLRWEHQMDIERGHQPYMLNNNWTSLYARLIMEREHDLDGVFEIRRRRATT